MTISVHLISIPEQEVVSSRVVFLPENGGEFGRGPLCDISLPDQTKRISRVHGHIKRSDKGYVIVDSSNNGSQLNERKLMSGKEYPLNDGDILKVENYTMLISTLDTAPNQTVSQPQDTHTDPSFSLDLEEDELDFLDNEISPISKPEPAHFSTDNVFNSDPFSMDPFEDLDPQEVVNNIEPNETPQAINSQPPVSMEYLPVSSEATAEVSASIEQLLQLTKENNQFLQNPNLQQQKLFEALEQTVDQFLTELAPTLLEKQFSDYMSHRLFSNKDKQYWRIYRKHFKHRQESGEYRRQFKAMFMENMQKQNEGKP